MSFAKVPLSVLTASSLSPGQKLVYAYFASYADRNGFTFVKPSTLTTRFPIDRPCLSRAKKALKAHGFLFEGKGASGIGIYLQKPGLTVDPFCDTQRRTDVKQEGTKQQNAERPKDITNVFASELPDRRKQSVGKQHIWNRDHAGEYRDAIRQISADPGCPSGALIAAAAKGYDDRHTAR